MAVWISAGGKHLVGGFNQAFSLRALRSVRLNLPVKLFLPPGFR